MMWAQSEVIHRATDPSTTSIEDVGRHHGGAYFLVAKEFLDSQWKSRLGVLAGARVT
jgi:hypothetical protein